MKTSDLKGLKAEVAASLVVWETQVCANTMWRKKVNDLQEASLLFYSEKDY